MHSCNKEVDGSTIKFQTTSNISIQIENCFEKQSFLGKSPNFYYFSLLLYITYVSLAQIDTFIFRKIIP